MIIGERILKILKDKKMTQAEFAKQTGIAASTVSEWKKVSALCLGVHPNTMRLRYMA